MRALSSVPNTDGASSDYPNGRIRNKDLAHVPPITGTPIVEELYGDIVQFFQKLIILSGITPDGNPDNESNGHQLIEALFQAVYDDLVADAVDAQDNTEDMLFLTPEAQTGRDGGLLHRILDIGSWNMDTTQSVTINVPSGIDPYKIKEYHAIIRKDEGDAVGGGTNNLLGAIDESLGFHNGAINLVFASPTSYFVLSRPDGSVWDASGYDVISSGPDNRGYLIVGYLP